MLPPPPPPPPPAPSIITEPVAASPVHVPTAPPPSAIAGGQEVEELVHETGHLELEEVQPRNDQFRAMAAYSYEVRCEYNWSPRNLSEASISRLKNLTKSTWRKAKSYIILTRWTKSE